MRQATIPALIPSPFYGHLTDVVRCFDTAVNVWSHLIAAMYFLLEFINLVYLKRTLSSRNLFGRLTSDSDLAAISPYCLCVTVCFTLSATFHAFSDHSCYVHRLGNNLDHVGIVFVLWGTGVSCTHFALRCAPSDLRFVYFAVISITAGLCAALTLRPCFCLPRFRKLRTLIYFFLGASLFVPLYPAWKLFGSVEMLDKAAGWRSFLALALVNSLGGVTYTARVPERWFPGRFDLLGQSHHWMHILVIIGAIIRLRGLLFVYERWMADEQMAAYCRGVM